jgi:hypothetical protein
MPETKRIAIIGSAGRGDDGARMTKDVFQAMVDRAREILSNDLQYKCNTDISLISGGAAWADHVAVEIFLRAHHEGKPLADLALFLPCPFDLARNSFADTGTPDWRLNPGLSANRYHREFSNILGRDTLAEVREAILCGAKAEVCQGFHARNTEVAKADVLIAFTWSDGKAPAKGGTLDTWRKCTGRKIHISISKLMIETQTQQQSGKQKQDIRHFFERSST